MKAFSGGPEDLLKFLMALEGASDGCVVDGCVCGGKHKVAKEVKMDPTDIAMHQMLLSRNQAIKKEADRARSKLIADSERAWADIKDKYNLHGYGSLHINAEKGVIEVLE